MFRERTNLVHMVNLFLFLSGESEKLCLRDKATNLQIPLLFKTFFKPYQVNNNLSGITL